MSISITDPITFLLIDMPTIMISLLCSRYCARHPNRHSNDRNSSIHVFCLFYKWELKLPKLNEPVCPWSLTAVSRLKAVWTELSLHLKGAHVLVCSTSHVLGCSCTSVTFLLINDLLWSPCTGNMMKSPASITKYCLTCQTYHNRDMS